MPASMTGFGDAAGTHDGREIIVEIRSVNNRHLKTSIRLPDGLGTLEAEIEKRLRTVASRGNVNVTVRCESTGGGPERVIDRDRLATYWTAWQAVRDDLGLPPLADGGRLIGLPGVIVTTDAAAIDAESHGRAVLDVLDEALASFTAFRAEEGAAMAAALREQAVVIATETEAVAAESAAVVTKYRDRLRERLATLLGDVEVAVADEAVAREAALFADKSDVTEEVVRLRSHLEQLETFLASDEAIGRKLDFLTQELNREVNTIGSKANDAGLARRVVAMKAAVEKIREILQNIE